jgi:hypothetical protein
MGARRGAGQAMVEFALVIPLFLLLMVGVFDLGRGIYEFNGVSQAAREIARTTSVHPGIVLGSSAETLRTIATQRALIPGMHNPAVADYQCLKIDGTASPNNPCTSGDFVAVTVRADFTPLAFLGFGGPMTLASTSSIQIP